MAAPRASAVLLPLLLILAVLPASAAGTPPSSAGLTGTNNACNTLLLGTDHCVVHHTGTVSVTCQGDVCALRFEGGAFGESRVPTDLWLTARVTDVAAPSSAALDLPLCEALAVGLAARCPYIVEHRYALPKGACVTLRHSTVLTQGYALFSAEVHQTLKLCRDGSGQPAVTLLPTAPGEDPRFTAALPPTAHVLP